MHSIRVLIAKAPTLADIQRLVPSATLCPLEQGWCLVPLTEAVEADLGASDFARTDPPEPRAGMAAGVASLAAALSATGPIVYAATEFFGGVGGQDALVWDGGAQVLDLHDDEDDMSAWPDSPISCALRHVGVVAFDDADEFDALGLGGHRSTDGWAQAHAPR